MFGINSQIKSEDAGNGVTRKVLTYKNDLMLVEVTFQKGAVGADHAHPHQQISYVAKGKIEFMINGEKTIVQSGDSIYIDSNMLHGAVALEDSIIVDVFTPIREDFLQ